MSYELAFSGKWLFQQFNQGFFDLGLRRRVEKYFSDILVSNSERGKLLPYLRIGEIVPATKTQIVVEAHDIETD